MPCGKIRSYTPGDYCAVGNMCEECINKRKVKKLRKALETIADEDKIEAWMIKKGLKKGKGWSNDPDAVNEALVSAMTRIAEEALKDRKPRRTDE
jgi:hypothetical protein